MTNTDLAKMPISEKIQLMESLGESLNSDAVADAAVPAWHGDVLTKRSVPLDQGQEPVSAWCDAKQRIRVQTAKQYERLHLLLIDEATRGLDDVAAGWVKGARAAIQTLKRRRAA